MKIAVFGPARRVGIAHDGSIIDANAAYARYLADTTDTARPSARADSEVPAGLNAFITEGKPALDGARAAVEHLSGDGVGVDGEQLRFALDEIMLHAPIEGASRIFAALANFADHMQAAADNTDDADAQATLARLQEGRPKYFIKDARCTSIDGDDVRYPARTEHLDYEAEVAAIIGPRGRDIPADGFRAHIWGYTLANDWSVRDNVSFGPDFQYSKNFDTAAGLGPWIVIDDDIDPHDIPIETRVNGELRQNGNTASMIHDFGALGAHLSRDMTLYPGDMILSGTPKGTAVDSSKRLDDGTFSDDSRFLKPGDRVEVTSTVLGSLRNDVTKAD
ncbi:MULTISPECIES: fumarylacetoacetate hydrolase family protein [Prauserella salsuginis group]|uniref:Fumarylacetoacetate hydrolase family protein n=1 Tax=Prauserella salsuginis TaxID=387889 RepID=A0ABW6G0Z9_9PSEU|nr:MULTISPECIES: fumarylacetoacetate hydrolase family protein [Prauserella salsuginis group]MCR3721991.1 2-keto-4-pentenoate hydratase/2-oxohepta-3-ene-1,7-dioic acid hydratase (catechol pathway) [Prauserella flava]MCR3735997.1 2-keto-4-pentenoate hydratase/2-oxohepta-3-ene-1,7-dioic acid hydratase (catechol pathway) [Prauserella salsuginis]